MSDPVKRIRLSDLLLTTPCEMRNCKKPGLSPLYWCDQCKAFSYTGECRREQLRKEVDHA